jgi:hypothetical protein
MDSGLLNEKKLKCTDSCAFGYSKHKNSNADEKSCVIHIKQ